MPDGRPTNINDTGEVRIHTTPSTTSTGQHQAINTGQQPAVRIAGNSGRARRWSALVLVIAAIVSFVAVGQLRGPDRFREQLNAETEGDLTRILASLSGESTALQEELSSLKLELANIQNSSQNEGAATAEANAQLNSLQVLAGTVPVTGAGIELTINDPNSQVSFDSLVDAVQELRDAGAEAITINGQRVGVRSAFGQRGPGVTLDGTVLTRPFTVSAIGPAATMEGGLKIPGGALDSLGSKGGVRVELSRNSRLTMAALADSPSFRSGRPLGSGS